MSRNVAPMRIEKKVAIKKILPQHSHNERFIDMLVDEAELEKRRAAWQAPPPRFERGYG